MKDVIKKILIGVLFVLLMLEAFPYSETYDGNVNESMLHHLINKTITSSVIKEPLRRQKQIQKNEKTIDTIDIILLVIPIVFIKISYELWSEYGKDDKKSIGVEVNPPEGLNSLDVGYIDCGKIKTKHIVSLIAYLASKGYLRIEEVEKLSLKSPFNEQKDEKTFKLVKLKDYDGNNEIEKEFFSGLFNLKTMNAADVAIRIQGNEDVSSIGNVINNNQNYNEITETELRIHFTNILNKIKNDEMKKYEDMLYDNKATSQIKYINIMMAILSLEIIIQFFRGTIFYGADIIFIISSIVALGFIKKIMKKRTTVGVDAYAKIEGYKMYIKSVELDKIKKLAEENPTYFYDVLPYAYALDLTNVWMEKFEMLGKATNYPQWYKEDEQNSFYDAFNEFTKKAEGALNISENSEIKNNSLIMRSSEETDKNKNSFNNDNNDKGPFFDDSNNSFGGFTGGGISGGGSSGSSGGSSW